MISLPTWVFVLVLLAVIMVLIGLWASAIANRLNRLHIRTDSARIKLEGALQARSAAIVAVDPKLNEMAADVGRVPLRATDMGAHSDVENHLLAQLGPEVLQNPGFIQAAARVDLAARFYNDAVADTREVRRRLAVRAFRLAGFAPLPEYYEAASYGHVG